MTKFIEAFEKWPAQNQVVFSVAALIVTTAMAFMFGWWLVQLVRDGMQLLGVLFRGHPPEPRLAGEDDMRAVAGEEIALVMTGVFEGLKKRASPADLPVWTHVEKTVTRPRREEDMKDQKVEEGT